MTFNIVLGLYLIGVAIAMVVTFDRDELVEFVILSFLWPLAVFFVLAFSIVDSVRWALVRQSFETAALDQDADEARDDDAENDSPRSR